MNSQDQGEEIFLTPKEEGCSFTNKKEDKKQMASSPSKLSGKDKEQNPNMMKF